MPEIGQQTPHPRMRPRSFPNLWPESPQKELPKPWKELPEAPKDLLEQSPKPLVARGGTVEAASGRRKFRRNSGGVRRNSSGTVEILVGSRRKPTMAVEIRPGTVENRPTHRRKINQAVGDFPPRRRLPDPREGGKQMIFIWKAGVSGTPGDPEPRNPESTAP